MGYVWMGGKSEKQEWEQTFELSEENGYLWMGRWRERREYCSPVKIQSVKMKSSFHGFITNQFNDLLPVGLLEWLVECRTGIAEVKGSNPIQAWIFFMFSFHNCISCVYNCDDLP